MLFSEHIDVEKCTFDEAFLDRVFRGPLQIILGRSKNPEYFSAFGEQATMQVPVIFADL
jgi:hypothetical protein